ncbi:putative membrane protein [Halapricum desulfuricans]|uniref:Putative membrane protein n=1 Tax=Halapricum desulfuricans TaxID=2841257 RepID=A0A897NFX2_9EURY|nr:hypothetical protein [Halapricum desulfuricans]QSG11334.1 putative membrane protein [Halapricum desulfuricans]
MNDGHRWSRLQEWLLVLAALSLILATYLFVAVEPASGFETSLVEQFPPGFWIAFYATMIVTVAVTMLSALSGTGYWRHATALLLANYALFFFLPLARGYRLYGRGASDILVHIGDVKGIIQTGTIAAGSWYPMQHTLVTELVLLGFPLQGAEYVVEFSFTAVYIVSMGYLLRVVTGRRETAAFGIVAATPLVFSIFQTTIIPSFLSLLLFPVILAILEQYRRSRSLTYLFLFLVFGIGTVFFHPVTAGFLVVLILSTTAFGYVYEWLSGQSVRKIRPTLAFMIAPATYLWYINFRETRTSIEQIVGTWLSGGSSPGQATVDSATEAPLTTAELLARFVELYGMVFVYLVVAGLFGLVVLYETVKRRPRYPEAYATAQFAVGFGLAVAFLVVYLIEFEPIRIARYLIVMAVFLYALLLVRASQWRPRRRQIGLAVLGTGVVFAAVLGANAAYWPNEQLTDTEYEGSEFVLTNSYQDVPIRTYSISHKMEWYVRGSVDPNLWPPNFVGGLQKGLGYNGSDTTVGDRFGETYLATHAFDRTFYTDSYFSSAQRDALIPYEQSDLDRLNADPTALRIYDNGGFEVWYVPENEEN